MAAMAKAVIAKKLLGMNLLKPNKMRDKLNSKIGHIVRRVRLNLRLI